MSCSILVSLRVKYPTENGLNQEGHDIILQTEWRDTNTTLFDLLQISSSYMLGLAVVSENWIGHASSQNPEVAVIRESHIIAKIGVTPSLSEIVSWLDNREYLPIEGRDYSIVHTSAKVGRWRTTWYQIKPLVEEGLMPL